MSENVRLIDPRKLQRNPENPRLIFHQDELEALQSSIKQQGILVPLTIYQDRSDYFLLDGERRWRCALKLNLPKVPVIIQPKPDKLQNLMMMFAIHNARKDWDPLPTALKLKDLEQIFEERNRRKPKEAELAELASLTRGEVRRLKKLLNLPQQYLDELMEELQKPRSKQELSVDQVLETTRAVDSLRKKSVITDELEEPLRRVIIDKFKRGVIKNTVSPRKLVKLGQAYERGDIVSTAHIVIEKLIEDPNYGIEEAYADAVEEVDFGYGVEQLADRLLRQLSEYEKRGYTITQPLLDKLLTLVKRLQAFQQHSSQ